MLEKRDKIIMSVTDAAKSLKRQKAIFIITDKNDIANLRGYITLVSNSPDTFKELSDEFHKLGDDIGAVLIGSYSDGSWLGMPYTIE